MNINPDYVDENGDIYYEDDLVESYEEMLDEVYGTVTIGYSEFSPADILRELEPVTYRVGLSDHTDVLGWDEWREDHPWLQTEDDEDDEDTNGE